LLLRYSQTPGLPAEAPPHWPAQSRLQRPALLPRLLVFVHPECPCSRATIAEIETLAPFFQNRLSVQILFFVTTRSNPHVQQSALWKRAAFVPGVELTADLEGQEARTFAVKTSGQALVYSTNAELLFAGGLTPERGHEGDSQGRDSVLAILQRPNVGLPTSSVFGCSLSSPERAQGLGLLGGLLEN